MPPLQRYNTVNWDEFKIILKIFIDINSIIDLPLKQTNNAKNIRQTKKN